MPVSSAEMRPSGLTPVASVMTRPAPPRAKEPRCTRCQSVGTPSSRSTEYWQRGDTQSRLRNVTERSVKGDRSAGVTIPPNYRGGMELEWSARDAARMIARPRADDDKYRRGVLGIETGSERYPG